MKDRVPLYPGRVKLTPVSGQENTYDMVRADEPTQEGTPLNKASLLTDATAALFGLGSDAVPDDALRLLGRFNYGLGNEYLWHKTKQTETIEEYSEGDTSGTLRTSSTHYYADSVEYDETKTYKAALKNPKKYTYSMDTVDSLVGKYITNGDPSKKTPYKITEITAKYSSSANWSGEITGLKKVFSVEDFGFLNSPESDAYPPSEPDGYDYVSLGQLGNKVRMVTGSYVGTNAKVSITLPFAPKYFSVMDAEENSNYISGYWILGAQYFNRAEANASGYNAAVSVQDNVISYDGFNSNTKTYVYITFG